MSKNPNFLRAIIGIILGIAVVFIALKLRDRIIAAKKQPEVKVTRNVTKVFADTVFNNTTPVMIKEKGQLAVLKTVDLFAEVQGILLESKKLFKPGQYYKKGELIFSIDDSEFASNIKSQRSVLYNQLAQSMPDVKLDYTEVYEKWLSYLKNFEIDRTLQALPEFDNDREKFFINSKGIVTSYYNIKNLEERQKKYRIYAPFNGRVTEALVYPGTLIRQGQQLGTIINSSTFEMPVSVDASYRKYIDLGKKVTLRTLDGSDSWNGRIARIDPVLNPTTQGIDVYVELSGRNLTQGMFLEAEIDAGVIEDSYELKRKLLNENKAVFVIEQDTLRMQPVDISFFKEKSAIITNLQDSTVIVKNAIPGAYEGMQVEIVNQ